MHSVEMLADQANEIDVPHFISSANVIARTYAALSEYQSERAGMIVYKKPIPNVRSIAVDWQRLIMQSI